MLKKVAYYMGAGILAVALLICPALASSFPDVADDAVYAEAAEYLNEVGIMQGDTQGNFNPNKNVTRAQMAAIICRMLGETESLEKTETNFSDVPASYWASGYIAKAAELGVIGGYQDGSFKPDNTVTYEQAVAMVVRAVGLDEQAVLAGGYPSGYISIATDYGYNEGFFVSMGTPMARKYVAMIIHNVIVF